MWPFSRPSMGRPLPLIADDDLDGPRGKRTQRGGPCSDRTRAASVAPPSYGTAPGPSRAESAPLARAGGLRELGDGLHLAPGVRGARRLRIALDEIGEQRAGV